MRRVKPGRDRQAPRTGTKTAMHAGDIAPANQMQAASQTRMTRPGPFRRQAQTASPRRFGFPAGFTLVINPSTLEIARPARTIRAR